MIRDAGYVLTKQHTTFWKDVIYEKIHVLMWELRTDEELSDTTECVATWDLTQHRGGFVETPAWAAEEKVAPVELDMGEVDSEEEGAEEEKDGGEKEVRFAEEEKAAEEEVAQTAAVVSAEMEEMANVDSAHEAHIQDVDRALKLMIVKEPAEKDKEEVQEVENNDEIKVWKEIEFQYDAEYNALYLLDENQNLCEVGKWDFAKNKPKFTSKEGKGLISKKLREIKFRAALEKQVADEAAAAVAAAEE